MASPSPLARKAQSKGGAGGPPCRFALCVRECRWLNRRRGRGRRRARFRNSGPGTPRSGVTLLLDMAVDIMGTRRLPPRQAPRGENTAGCWPELQVKPSPPARKRLPMSFLRSTRRAVPGKDIGSLFRLRLPGTYDSSPHPTRPGPNTHAHQSSRSGSSSSVTSLIFTPQALIAIHHLPIARPRPPLELYRWTTIEPPGSVRIR